MILKMYALKDDLRGFANPINFISEELAKRYFRLTVKQDPEKWENRDEINLYYIGTFDTETGTIIMDKKEPEKIMKGVDVIDENSIT